MNPNLLRWTEDLTDPVWVAAGGITITPDAATDPLGGATADQIAFTGGTLTQTSQTAVTTVTGFTATRLTQDGTFRESITGNFDGSPHVLSFWSVSGVVGFQYRIEVTAAGGFARVRLNDFFADNPTMYLWGFKLEVGGVPTGTAATYGRRTT